MDKIEIRNISLEKRKEIPKKEEKSSIIQNQILNNPLYQDSQIVAFYNSTNSEVSTKDLIRKSLLQKNVVLLPKIVDKRMVFIKINENTRYEISPFHILEPIGEEYIGDIDLIIVPGVAFTKDGKRLGYGGGYYDKYLGGKNIKTIGICFEDQIVEDIPIEEHDRLVDYVLTEENTYERIQSYQKKK